MSKGSESQFQEMVHKLGLNIRSYEIKNINYIKFIETVDYIFSSYGWSKDAFYKELNDRLKPNYKEESSTVKPKKKPIRKKAG